MIEVSASCVYHIKDIITSLQKLIEKESQETDFSPDVKFKVWSELLKIKTEAIIADEFYNRYIKLPEDIPICSSCDHIDGNCNNK